MASGRSGQLVLTGAKAKVKDDAFLKTPRASRHAHADPAYFLQRRFHDTALVVFRQHVRRLKEASPGHYTPLPTTTTPTLHLIPGQTVPPGARVKKTPPPHGDPSFSSSSSSSSSAVGSSADRKASGESAHLPVYPSSQPRNSDRKYAADDDDDDDDDDDHSDSSAGPAPGVSGSAAAAEANGVSWQQEFLAKEEGELLCSTEDLAAGSGDAADPAVSLSDSSSVASSAPDSDLVEEEEERKGVVPDAGTESSLAGRLPVQERSVGSDRNRPPARSAAAAAAAERSVTSNGQGQGQGQGRSGGGRGEGGEEEGSTPHVRSSPASAKPAPSAHRERRSIQEVLPSSSQGEPRPAGTGRGPPPAGLEAQPRGHPQPALARNPSPLSSSEGVDDACDSSEEGEIQITRL